MTGLLGMLLGASIPAEASDSNSAPAIADYRSKYPAVGLSRSAPAFSFFSVDSLGQGKVALNPVLQKTNTVAGLTLDENLKDMKWGRDNYDKLEGWAREMMASDKDGNGLIEYPATGIFGDRLTVSRRPSNWWDTINFGHEDAYANALAYRACNMFSSLAAKLGNTTNADAFSARTARIKAVYAKTFLNPETGVLAGWKSIDGQLHDYWFTFVNGAAITGGLVDDTQGYAIMDRILKKMQEVSYTNFSIGLPGNLVPIKNGDYIDQASALEVFGVPRLDDGSDGFQYYENGGTTGCFAYYTSRRFTSLAVWLTPAAFSTRCSKATRMASSMGLALTACRATGATGKAAATAMRAFWSTITSLCSRCWMTERS